MKPLFAHQFFKDFRQTRILWGAWLLLTGLQFALAAWNISSSDFLAQNSYAQLAGMLPLFQRLLLCVLVPALILQEPTVGTTAFWLTRPMPRGIVLQSKLLALLILVLLPTLGQCTVLLAHQVLAGDVFLAGLQILLHELSWIAVLMMLAALSPSVPRYLIALVLLFGLEFLVEWILTIISIAKAAHTTNTASLFLSPGLLNSRAVAADLLKIPLCLGTLCFQYQTRRIRLAIALAAVSLLLPFLTARYWPWDFLSSPISQNTPSQADSTHFQFTINPQSNTQSNGSLVSSKNQPVPFYSQISFQNSGAPKAVQITPLSSEFTLSNGRKLPTLPLDQSPAFFSMQAPLEGTSESINATLGHLPMLICQNGFGSTRQPILMLSQDNATAYAGQRGKLTLRIKVQLYGYRIAAEWPLREESIVRRGSERLILSKIQKQQATLQVDLQDRKVNLQLRPDSREESTPITMYALLNPSKQESVLATTVPNYWNFMNEVKSSIFSNLARFGLPGGGNGIESLSHRNILFGDSPYGQHIELPLDLDASWRADAKLLQLESVPEGEFETTVTVEEFRIARPNENSFSSSETPTSAEGLTALHLPAHASRAETWQYIQQILTQSSQNRSFEHDDPAIKLLTQIGPQNADLLFYALYNRPYGYGGLYLQQAINQMDLQGTPCKPMLLQFLSTQNQGYDELIESVRKNHWESAAEPILLERLKESNTSGNWVREEWVLALASLRDPATYPTLLTYAKNRMEKGNNQLNLIRAIPGSLISELLADLWKKARGSKKEGDLLGTATSWGVTDALQRSAEILRVVTGTSKEEQSLKNQARETLKNATACPTNGLLDQELAAWYESNKPNLTFDPHLGRFLPHARPVVDQQAAWPQPSDYFKNLGELAAKGETAAIDDLSDALTRLTEGLDPVRDHDRIRDLRNIAWNAFNVLRDKAVKDPSVFHVLEYANSKEGLNQYFVPNGYSAAATEGNQTAIDALLHYQIHQWSLTDALNNLRGAAGKNNSQAVSFFLTIFADPGTPALPEAKDVWRSLGEGLRAAANAGNAQALAAYKAFQKLPAPEK